MMVARPSSLAIIWRVGIVLAAALVNSSASSPRSSTFVASSSHGDAAGFVDTLLKTALWHQPEVLGAAAILSGSGDLLRRRRRDTQRRRGQLQRSIGPTVHPVLVRQPSSF